MRIVCEKCAAKYSVEDRLITPRGVRAQCPRCRHAQVLRAGDPAPPPATPSPPPSDGPARPASLADCAVPPPAPLAEPSAGPDIPFDPFASHAGCQRCGKPLVDPFDQAVGECEACRAQAEAARATGDGAGPPADPGSAAPSAPAPAARHPEPPPPEPSVYSAARPGGPGARPRQSRRVAIAGGALLLAAGALAGWFYARPRPGPAPIERTPPPSAGKKPPEPDEPATAASHSSPKLVAEGERLLRERGEAGAQQAHRAFEEALEADLSNGAAVAGFARSLALAASRMDDGQFEQSLSLLARAEKRAKDRGAVALARAEVMLARPTRAREAEARDLAERVLSRTEDPLRRARAHRVVGLSWQSTSSALAAKSLGEALALDPRLEDAWSERAAARAASGDYAGALADLEKRLEMTPLHWESLDARSRIFREVGQPARARAEYERILKKDPRHLRARLAVAAVRYQAEGKPKDAVRELRSMAGALSRYGAREQAEILVHLAAAQRAAGDRRQAERAARDALGRAPDDPAARFQLLLLAIDRRDSTAAEQHLAAIAGKLGDEAVERLVEGRVRMLQSRWEDAQRAFRAAHDADRRRVDALLLAGLSASRARRGEEALQYLAEAARADPARSSPPAPDARFYFEPREFLEGHAAALASLGKRRGDARPHLFEGLLRFHAGDVRGADKRLRAAVAADEGNALSLAWRAVAALRAGDKKGARVNGARAVAQERLLGLGHYALGAALVRSGESAAGRKALMEAVRVDPGLLGAEYELAALDAKQGDAAGARQRLVRLVTLDPSFVPAKELLFALGRETPREGVGPR